MIWFELQPLDTLPDDQVLLAWAEIFALATGSVRISDLQLDEETVLSTAPKDERFSEIEDMFGEPTAAFKRVQELVEQVLIAEAGRVAELYAFDYPFEISPDLGTVLKLRDSISENTAGACYLAMQFQQLIRNELAQVWTSEPGSETKRAEDQFHKNFDDLFEVVATVSIAAEHGGFPFSIGASRSVKKSLLPAIQEMGKIAEGVRPKHPNDLNAAQLAANDGGTDGVVVRLINFPPHEVILVGATRQASNTRNKVVGADQEQRFRDYLVDPTRLGQYRRAFAHAEPINDGTKEHCFERGCAYHPRERILEHLCMLAPADRRMRALFLKAERKAAQHLKELATVMAQVEFERLQLPCSAE